MILWLDLLALREAVCGELHPVNWQRLVDGLRDAVKEGRPVWPSYAAAKRDWRLTRLEVEVVLPKPSTAPDPGASESGRRKLVSALVAALDEIADRKARGEIS